jgi:hypothetical protein
MSAASGDMTQCLVALGNNVFETFLIFYQQPKVEIGIQKVGEKRDTSTKNNRVFTISCGRVIH